MPKATKVTVGELFDKVVDIKDKIYSDHPDIGGVLVHLLAVEDMNTIVNTKPFVFNLASPGTDDCAQTTPKPGQNGPNLLGMDLSTKRSTSCSILLSKQ